MAVAMLSLRAAGVGDLLTAVPALRALADHQGPPGILVAAPQWLHPLVALIPGVVDSVPVDGLTPRQDLSEMVAFNMHGRGPQSHQAMLSRHPKELVAFHCPGTWEFGPQWWLDEDEPERQRLCRLVRWVGIDADSDRLAIRRPDRDVPRDRIVLHVGGTEPRKRWPAGHFAALARRLPTRDILVTGGPGDVVAAQQVAHAAGLKREQVLAGRLDLVEFAAVIADARLLVSGDTGAAHLAHAYGITSVLVFGPASPGQWGPPPGLPSQVLRAPGREPQAADVPVDDVEKAVNLVLEPA